MMAGYKIETIFPFSFFRGGQGDVSLSATGLAARGGYGGYCGFQHGLPTVRSRY